MVRQPLISWAEGDGHRVLQVGAPALHHVPVLLLQPSEGLHQPVNGRQQLVLQRHRRRNVHGRGEGVVGALGHVYVVVGVEQLLPRQLVAPVGHDLVARSCWTGCRCPSATPPAGSARPASPPPPRRRPGWIRPSLSSSSFPSLWLASAAAFFRIPKARTISSGIFSVPIWKFSIAPLGLRTPVAVRGDLHLPH